MTRLQAAFGRIYSFMMTLACIVLLVIVGSIAADVLLRNVAVPGLPRGLTAANDISEYGLYFCTLLAAPALLRAGQHIRVDILLRAVPRQVAWACEWVSDAAGLAACAALAWMGWIMVGKSYAAGAMQTRSLVVPEWWLLAGMPIAFALLAIEFAFRMWRLAHGPVEPRSDAVSAA
ncbi:TRAP transporter small permease [Variovorax sp. OV700]|uniref:TRAP transporter small permease n=1 Tax=Variovorax sp. OV700 TaxID=1882826 RepID=UPI000880FD28|nr:TRAP transporter small permease subunit [Variovorax sp. OV700]SDH53688.1 TRAP-type C4-dicarboxylate transport system, small permease component [Variovorax sp. OV700]